MSEPLAGAGSERPRAPRPRAISARRRLLRCARPRHLVLGVALGGALAGLAVAQAALLAGAIATVVGPDGGVAGPGAGSIALALAGLGAVIVARAFVVWAQEIVGERAATAVKVQLRAQLLAHVGRAGPAFLTTARSGELTTLATRGLDALDGYVARYLPQVVLAVLAPVVVLAWVLPADLIAGLTILATLPLIPVFMVLVGRTTERLNRRRTRLLGRLAHYFLDVVTGLPTLRAFGRTAAVGATITRGTDAYRRATMATLRLAFVSSLVLELLATLSVALVAVGIGLRLVGGSLDLRTALLVLILAPEAYLPLRALGTHYHASADGLAAAGEVFDVLDQPVLDQPLGAAGVWTEERGSAATERRGKASGQEARSRASGASTIMMDRVTVRYPDTDAPALRDFSLTVNPGEIVALAGPSGSGKSTVLGVLLGFVPLAGGRVLASDVELSGVDPDAWRRTLAWVPQRPYLVAGTIADNVRLGTTASDAAVRRALAAAGALSFVDVLPAGIGTVIGDGGHRLSAGQRQRVALARALARDAPVLLLDEPTSFLDSEAEAVVLAAIRAVAPGRTVLVAAHRASLLALADRVVRLEQSDVDPAAARAGTV